MPKTPDQILDADLKRQVQAFERDLDKALTRRPIFTWDATATLRLVCDWYEHVAARSDDPSGPGHIDRALAILGPYLVSGSTGVMPDLTDNYFRVQMMDDLEFAGHYYMVRELLYYTYNAKESVSWAFLADRVEARFADKSLPRQFFTVFNDQLLGSMSLFQSFKDDGARIHALLADEPEGADTPKTREAWGLIEREVDLKLSAYFNLVPADSDINLGGYTYAEFLSVYRVLTAKALYHRYLAQDRGFIGAIHLPQDDFLTALEDDLELAPDRARAILKDIVYDDRAATDRLDGSYFSLFREAGGEGPILMRPHHFATDEGLVNLLRVVAQRRPLTFLRSVSNVIGSAFVQRVKAAWEAEGFTCHTEVSLRDIDPTLPDVDLMVISEEPTLGYVIFICELKSPIPPKWAKDQLKALNADGVAKAFRQADALKAFLRTEAGMGFIARHLPKGGHPHFDGFIVLLHHLVITSDNGGMFFGGETTGIIAFKTLERLLKRSDGDMALIQHVLATYAEKVDEAVVIVTPEFPMDGRTVSYEGVGPGPLIDFPQGEWRSWADRQGMVDEFMSDGHHPFDSLDHRPPDAVVVDHSRKVALR
ncbi:MAG: hypothetical protein P0Y52_04890 [Candidatus Brevundimonas phytovorans]|nr:hypothetical protein [Brevundimonas sp.]WEK58875.1 MAG: hypothetical protein P0Y52_04890 [Brevundimonas sp.]